MTQTLFIRPASGLKVRDPITKQHLREEGESKPRTNYWLRRVRAGEVVVINKPTSSDAVTAEKPNTKKGGE